MPDTSYALAVLGYVSDCHMVLNFPVRTLTALIIASFALREALRRRRAVNSAELTQCSVQVTHWYPNRHSVDSSTQTECLQSVEVGVATECINPPLRFCMESQTTIDSVEFEKLQSNSAAGINAPTTPTTMDSTELINTTAVDERYRFGLPTDLPSLSRVDGSNDDMEYILNSAIQSALSETTPFTTSIPQQSMIPEVAYADDEEEEDDQFNMGLLASRSIESRKTSSIFHDSDVLFSNVTAWSPEFDRFTTSDTVVSGGGIYRTLSEPVGSTIPLEEWMPSSDDPPLISELKALDKIIQPSIKFESEIAAQISSMQTLIQSGFQNRLNLSEDLARQINLIPFGSIASGCALTDSAIDLVLVVPPDILSLVSAKTTLAGRTLTNTSASDLPLNQLKEFETRLQMKQALNIVSDILTTSSCYTAVRLTGVGSVSTNFSLVRVPTLYLDSSSQHRFEISCNNLFPLFSTRLIKAYKNVGGNVLGEFILLVKYWAKCRSLGGAGSTKMTGFIWSLLAVFYCQSACLGLIPSLQALCNERKQWKDPFGSRRCDVGFVDDLEITGQGYLDGLDAGSLFVGFIDFYANYWNWNTGVVSVRLGKSASIDSPEILLKQAASTLGGCTEKFTRLHIEDPFDTKRDLGLCLNANTGAELRREFTNASLLIASGNANVGQLFAEATCTVKSPRVAKKFVMTNRRTESCQ